VKCQFARHEGGYWEACQLPDTFMSEHVLPRLAGIKPGYRFRRMLDLRAYGKGFVAVVKLPNGLIYDPELTSHGISGWRFTCPKCDNRCATASEMARDGVPVCDKCSIVPNFYTLNIA
jgi:hypothetical protein